ncbi:hypothetical protein [Cupriavidus malaysiensis]|uniref:Uncharacterized protein n=1 Tax=Cupriavidus malaysiensis TaxID=367825 RepID=A0A1D9I383_9BURK|nr:hypothetical protein [Cupriavidus malaysiensis]AOZ06549.1 hypothetical protein BKK80_12515 [Cupriavidus malaysiensis]
MDDVARKFDVQAVIDGRPGDPGYVKWFADRAIERAHELATLLDDLANLREPFDEDFLSRANLAVAELRALTFGVQRAWLEKFKLVGYSAWETSVVEQVNGQRERGEQFHRQVRGWFDISEPYAEPRR